MSPIPNIILLGSLIDGVGFRTAKRGRGAELQFISSQADGGFRLCPLCVWDKGGFKFPDQCLVSLVDRPGAKVRREPPCRLTKFRCGCIETEVVAGFEFGTIRLRLHDRVSPTRVEDEDAFRIGAEVLPLNAGRGRDLFRNERPSANELLLEGLLLGENIAYPKATPNSAITDTPRMLRRFMSPPLVGHRALRNGVVATFPRFRCGRSAS